MTTRNAGHTRAIAIDALTHVLTRNMHADTALERLFATHSDLRPLDRAFIFEIVYGCLRWLAKMDWIMSHMMTRPFSSLDPRVANALRVGTYQIYYMDRVPDRAAVSETVEATKIVGIKSASTFVNAILRRVARKSEYFPKPDKDLKPVEYLSMHYSYPSWMIERWYRELPLERLEHLLSGNNTLPVQNLRIVTHNPVPSGEDLATYLLRSFGITSSWRPLKNVLQVDKLPPFAKCEAFKAGCYIVQDEAAQLAASIVEIKDDETILDACAAPGGKAIHLWDDGARPENLTVCDFSQKRLVLLKDNFSRVNLEGVEILHGDVIELVKDRTFHKVVLDAPCSAMGVIRRHPESKWLRTLADVERCAREQAKLLAGLAGAVQVGGELVYIVCSHEPEETTRQIESFLEARPEFERVPLEGRIHNYYRRYVTKNNEVLLYSGNTDALDGFYAVVLKRTRK